jgi:hypothetical protein
VLKDTSHAQFITHRDEEDLRSLLKTVYGQRFISRLLISCGVHKAPIALESKELTYIRIGMQQIGNAILQEVMRIKPEVYATMAKMNREDEDAREREYEQRADADAELD